MSHTNQDRVMTEFAFWSATVALAVFCVEFVVVMFP